MAENLPSVAVHFVLNNIQSMVNDNIQENTKQWKQDMIVIDEADFSYYRFFFTIHRN